MVDYRKYPNGKDRNTQPGIELNGEYIESLDIIIALTKALIRKGVLTRAELMTEMKTEIGGDD